ncbi:class I SAM-dependent methyltransferase [Flavicella sp.]|uniref:class I SAM-dependent methyltransferase n=1 Tax=Flavicella sp. TaxID=2957742 RepID=UPI00260FC5A4|nr:class I SAM-dependent methyltransferase [Flavicella sp.]MDG1805314.1 class I SAM-dependent methyltransferase [Flavicella sp.]MDG2280626.1 class I SAM-dependent methyltransferase [Flavicella sp.]
MHNENSSKRKKTPWPTKKAMAQIYEQNLWGANGDLFYSGDGSHKEAIITPYIKKVSEFLDSFEKPITVCDLGCGDFNIGKQLVAKTSRYIAVDIVPKLIDYNKTQFSQANVKFECLDIAKDRLPTADCVLIRQVLQHLSNAEVHEVVKKIKQYKYVILTEHIPNGDFVPNIDIISGQGIRIKKKSGLDLMKPPFDLKAAKLTELISLDLEGSRGCIKTVLYQMF